MGNVDYNSLLQAKYDSLIDRSFKTKLELFLFDKVLNNQLIDLSQFSSYSITDDIVDLYEKSWQVDKILGMDVNEIDRLMIKWYKENKETIYSTKKAYRDSFESLLALDSLAEIYPKAESMRKCSYCDITEKELSKLREDGKILTKNARGKHHEIDRLNSNKEYTKDNIVLACYWCNNAKTDEFTIEEFRDHIGPAIKKVWEGRKS